MRAGSRMPPSAQPLSNCCRRTRYRLPLLFLCVLAIACGSRGSSTVSVRAATVRTPAERSNRAQQMLLKWKLSSSHQLQGSNEAAPVSLDQKGPKQTGRWRRPSDGGAATTKAVKPLKTPLRESCSGEAVRRAMQTVKARLDDPGDARCSSVLNITSKEVAAPSSQDSVSIGHEEDQSNRSNRRVTVAVFAGRRRFLAVLCRYLAVLLDMGLVHEVHVWDMALEVQDRRWLRALEALDSRFEVKGCTWDASSPLRRFSCAYEYYSQQQSPSGNQVSDHDDVLVKVDDDVVYMDLPRFSSFIAAVKEGHIYLPNIINNDVCMHIQSRLGVHPLLPDVPHKETKPGYPGPLTKLSKNASLAQELHSMFHGCPGRFRLDDIPGSSRSRPVPWFSRVSINMFALTRSTARWAFRELLTEHRFHSFFEDEGFLTGLLVTRMRSRKDPNPHFIFPGFTVAHFAFKKQLIAAAATAELPRGSRSDWVRADLASYTALSSLLTCRQ